MENKYTSDEYVIQKLTKRCEYMEFLIQGVRKFGSKRFNDSLCELGLFKRVKKEKSLNKDEFAFFSEEDNRTVSFILDLVVKEWKQYSITKKDLFESVKRQEYVKCRNMAILLMKANTSISDAKIGEFFNRCRQVVFTAYLNHKKLKRAKVKNRLYLERYDRFNKLVVIYKKKYKTKN